MKKIILSGIFLILIAVLFTDASAQTYKFGRTVNGYYLGLNCVRTTDRGTFESINGKVDNVDVVQETWTSIHGFAEPLGFDKTEYSTYTKVDSNYHLGGRIAGTPVESITYVTRTYNIYPNGSNYVVA